MIFCTQRLSQKLNLALALFYLVSCSTTQKVKTLVKPESVTSSDFQKQKKIEYDKERDIFKKVEDQSQNISSDESLQRSADPTDTEISSILDDIIINCYEKKFTKAFNQIQVHYEKYKEHPIFWNQVGTCFLFQGNKRKALLFYNKALEFKASYAPAYNNLGVMYRLQNEDPKALVAFTRAKKSNPSAKTPRFNLAQLYLEYGLYHEALPILKSLYQTSPKDEDVLSALANAYLMEGNIKESVKFFKKINDDFWKDPHVGINYALALFFANKKEKALNIFSDVDQKRLGTWKEYYQLVARKIGARE